MTKYFKLLLVALAGGFISLWAYDKFIMPEKVKIIEKETSINTPVFTAGNNVVAAEALTDFTKAAEETVNAVVHVKNTSIAVTQDPFAELFFGGGYGRKYERVGTGSGVLISPDGYIITNNHVIEDASEIEITLNNKKKYKAELIGADKSNDIALVKIKETDLDFITFGNSDQAKIGEWVLAVGNPYNLTSTVTAGIISAKGRDLEGNSNIESFIQTDAAVNPGNSGGALVNTRGELIGINTAISSQTGSFVGYSFAVPSNIAKKIIEDLMEHGNVQKAVLGISYDPTKDEVDGVYVTDIEVGAGAEKAGMKKGDVIKKINNVKIKKFSDLKGQLTAKRPGDIVNVTVDREGEKLILSVKLSNLDVFNAYAFGLSFKNMSESEKKKLGIKNGIKVTGVNSNDIAKLGIRPGYVIVEINGYNVNSLSEIKDLSAKIKDSKDINRLVVINLDGEKETFSRGW